MTFDVASVEQSFRLAASELGNNGDTAALAAAVGRHPLALSVAASTIVANAMTVADWIEEFTATSAACRRS